MTIFGFYVSAAVFWLGLAVIFLIIEALTVGLTTIWFAAGSFVALLLSLFDVSVIIQFVVFLIVSFCLLLFTRRIFVEKLKTGSQATNTDALIGQTAETISEIRPLVTGQVRINGQVWSAVGADDDAVIPCGTHVKIIAIEGVKLLVKPEED
ncbi:MAG: NfeD family protein [Anaerovoracaceae bacterium]|nr:NfeD family protein [Anaerovoracaceae bacterium]